MVNSSGPEGTGAILLAFAIKLALVMLLVDPNALADFRSALVTRVGSSFVASLPPQEIAWVSAFGIDVSSLDRNWAYAVLYMLARLGYATGAVSFSPAGEDDWVQAAINRPLTTGDRLWADAGARAEVQVGGAAIRMNASTSVAVLNLDDAFGMRDPTGKLPEMRHQPIIQAIKAFQPLLALCARVQMLRHRLPLRILQSSD